MARNGHKPELTPDYIDRVSGNLSINKITIAPGDPEREVTILLRPNVGREGRRKDVAILEYLEEMQKKAGEDDANDFEIVRALISDPEEEDRFIQITADILGQDPEFLDDFTLMEIFQAFQNGMKYRMGGMNQERVDAAIKKYQAEAEKAA